jgi:hypothetical protein
VRKYSCGHLPLEAFFGTVRSPASQRGERQSRRWNSIDCADWEPRYPITGIAACCARAAGQPQHVGLAERSTARDRNGDAKQANVTAPRKMADRPRSDAAATEAAGMSEKLTQKGVRLRIARKFKL